MIFNINEIPIYFPYNQIYPEQLNYIKSLLKSIIEPGHVLIEMPSGTGKTISLLSCTISYQIHCKKKNKPFKIIYCTRTIAEIEKALMEMKNLVEFIKKHIELDFLGFGLASRTNMCINEEALSSGDVNLVCSKMRNRFDDLDCDFYNNTKYTLPAGAYSLEDLKILGKVEGFCSYYIARKSMLEADCLIYPYNYMIDPAIFVHVSEKLPKECVVIFDEAHNIDSVCINALSIDLNRDILVNACKALKCLELKLKEKKGKLAVENKKLLNMESVLRKNKLRNFSEDSFPYYFTPDFYTGIERNYEYVPGNLRQSNHFISLMKRLIEFLKAKLKSAHLTTETPESFLQSIAELTFIDKDSLRFSSSRLSILVNSIQFEHPQLFNLRQITRFATMLSIYGKGFQLIFEPYDSMVDVFNPYLRLYCMDSSICMQHVFRSFQNVVITSGTLSPPEMYSTLLNFTPKHVFLLDITLERNSISPLIISKGDDQILLNSSNQEKFMSFDEPKTLTTSYKHRIDGSVVRNYGNLLISLSKTVPDNIIVFFPSYLYMEEIVTLWSKSNIIYDIVKNKLVFIETPNISETNIALDNYKKCCDNGRGGMLFCVARGKVSEGIDLKDGYARAAVVLGVPFMFTESIRLKSRLKYLFEVYGIKDYDFLLFDAMKHTAQCLGRVLRKKDDYGIMILADQRFNSKSKIDKLPRWIKERIEDGHTGLSIEMAMNIAKHYFKSMAQPIESYETTLIDEKNVTQLFIDDD